MTDDEQPTEDVPEEQTVEEVPEEPTEMAKTLDAITDDNALAEAVETLVDGNKVPLNHLEKAIRVLHLSNYSTRAANVAMKAGLYEKAVEVCKAAKLYEKGEEIAKEAGLTEQAREIHDLIVAKKAVEEHMNAKTGTFSGVPVGIWAATLISLGGFGGLFWLAKHTDDKREEKAARDVAEIEISREVDDLFTFYINWMNHPDENRSKMMMLPISDNDYEANVTNQVYPEEGFYAIRSEDADGDRRLIFQYHPPESCGCAEGKSFAVSDLHGDGVTTKEEANENFVQFTERPTERFHRRYLEHLVKANKIIEERHGKEKLVPRRQFPRFYQD